MEKNVEETIKVRRRIPVLPIIVIMFFVFPVSTITYLWGTETFSPANIKKSALYPEMPDPLREALTIATCGLTNIQMAGKTYYEKYCAVCHGEHGKGDGFNAYNLDPRPKDLIKAVNVLSSEALFKAVWDGIAGQDGKFLCPPWGRTLGENEINATISYIHALEKIPSESSNTP